MDLTCRAVSERKMQLNTIIGIPCGWIYSILGSVLHTPYSSVTVFGNLFSIVSVSVLLPAESIVVI